MPRLTIIKLLGYREWTESLGDDREWIIQTNQSKTYTLIQQLFSKKQGFAIPIRYDYYIALSNGIDKETHREILLEIESIAPSGVKIVSLTHKYPFTAQLLGTRILEESSEKLVYIDGKEDENIILHIDFNDITAMTYMTSVFETYMKIMSFYTNITYAAARLGGITTYLGGDNMIAIMNKDTLREFINNIPSYVKIGGGSSYYPRKALELAARALAIIRKNREKHFLLLSDGEARGKE